MKFKNDEQRKAVMSKMNQSSGKKVVHRIPKKEPRTFNKFSPGNPMSRAYGSMPTGGGFNNYTEYEISAQRIGEEIHCILGSLSASEQYNTPEEGHITEEIMLINKNMQEYNGSNYIGIWWDRESEKYKKLSKQSIQKAGNQLTLKSRMAKDQLFNYQNEMQEDTYMVAVECYNTLTRLGNEMHNSVANSDRPKYNAIDSDELKIAVHHLNSAVRKYLKNRGHKNLEEQVWHSYYKNPY